MLRKRHYLISAAILAVCVCVALGVLAMLPPRPGVTKANFERIQEGMTFAEVEAILGKESKSFTNVARRSSNYFWISEEEAVILIRFHFDDRGLVSAKTWTDSTETIHDKLRRWLHLPK